MVRRGLTPSTRSTKPGRVTTTDTASGQSAAQARSTIRSNKPAPSKAFTVDADDDPTLIDAALYLKRVETTGNGDA